MTREHRPDVESLLAPLKGFQRKTVDYAFRRMYLDADPAVRFLIADEVGLGKTLIARGITARAIDHMWEGVKRIDVVYVCSSIAIAQQNLQKLSIGGAEHRAITSRLTLLPRELKGLNERKVNFVAFTPSTSFDLKSKGGRMDERMVLYQLLAPMAPELRSGLRNLLQGGVHKPRWRDEIAARRGEQLDETLVQKFAEGLGHPDQADLLDRLKHAVERFHRYRDDWSSEHLAMRRDVVGDLRMLLASTCVDALEPDLIILDEFQRFRELLSGEDEMSRLARAMWNYTAPEGHRARVLLLSATPYRMYSTDSEVGADDHYPDFIRTTGFLMDGDEQRVGKFEGSLRDYRKSIHSALQGGTRDVSVARDAVQEQLGRVMVRTERVRATEDRAAMMEEVDCKAEIGVADLRQWVFVDKLAQAVGARDTVSMWKSAPYLAQFMGHRNYDLKRRLRRNLDQPEVVDTVKAHKKTLLRRRNVQRYEALDPANARMRVLAQELLEGGQYNLLWIPPTMPYWPLSGTYADQGAFTKSLIFSAWQVVPDVVSAYLSYEAERRMLGPIDDDAKYQNLYRKRRGLLRFSRSEDRLTGMTALVLQYPCLTLADAVHPISAMAAGDDPRIAARTTVERLVGTLPDPGGRVDERWYWAAPVLLDAAQNPTDFLSGWRLQEPAASNPADWDKNPETDDSAFSEHVALLRAVVGGEQELGAQPADLADVLTDIALGAPGTLATRSLLATGADNLDRQRGAALIAEGLRTLFNQPTAMAVVQRLHPKPPYWRGTLRYAIDGGLAAVLDEHFHQQWGELSWRNLETNDACHQVAARMGSAATVKVSRVNVDDFRVKQEQVELDTIRLRTSFALRYGRIIGDKDTAIAREGAVRAAFNSPYRPFVLASTSIGQEGLDFHPWCHRIVHWNLPGNPVDLEQREGRVHRYEGHAVRKNVAASYGQRAIKESWQPGEDVWATLFDAAAAARPPGTSDLVPWWLCDGPHKVQRVVPILPFSREHRRLKRLKRDLVAYRLAFGQPRQEELLSLVHGAEVSIETIDGWTLSLSPPDVELSGVEPVSMLNAGAPLVEGRAATESARPPAVVDHDAFDVVATTAEPPTASPSPRRVEKLRRRLQAKDLPRCAQPSRVIDLVVQVVEHGALEQASQDETHAAYGAYLLGFFDRDGEPTAAGELLVELDEEGRGRRTTQAFAETRVARRWVAWAKVGGVQELSGSSAGEFLEACSAVDSGAPWAGALVAWLAHFALGDAGSDAEVTTGHDVADGTAETPAASLPRDVHELFTEGCEELSLGEAEALRDEVDAYLRVVVRAGAENALIPVSVAEYLADGLDEMFASYGSLDGEQRALVVGAGRYFVSAQDARPDLRSSVGLEDDRAVFEWVRSVLAPTLDSVGDETVASRVAETAELDGRKLSAGERSQLEYWTSFAAFVREHGELRPPKPQVSNWMAWGLGRTGAQMMAQVTAKEFVVGVNFDNHAHPTWFSQMRAQKAEIEEELGFGFDWQEKPGNRYSVLRVRTEADARNPGTWMEGHAWMLEALVAIERVFRERVTRLDDRGVQAGPDG